MMMYVCVCVCSGVVFAPEAQRDLSIIQVPCPDPTTAISIVTQKVGTRTKFTPSCSFNSVPFDQPHILDQRTQF